MRLLVLFFWSLLLASSHVTDTAFSTAVQGVHVSDVPASMSLASSPGVLKNPSLHSARLSAALLQVTDPAIELSTGVQALHVSIPPETAVWKNPSRQTASLLPALVQYTDSAPGTASQAAGMTATGV